MVEPEAAASRVGGHRAAERVVVDELGDRRVLPADRALGVLADPHRAVAHLQGVIDHQPTDQRVAHAGDQLDGLVDLDRADGRAQHAEHAALGARRHHAGRRRLRVQAPVARAVLGPEHAGLAVEPVDRAPHVGLAEQHAGVVDQVAGREVVGAVDDQVVLAKISMTLSLSSAVSCTTTLTRGLISAMLSRADSRLGPADVGLAVDDLALQVGLVDDVEVDDAERADAGRGQVHQGRRAQPPAPTQSTLAFLSRFCPVIADVRDDQVPRVAPDLVDGQVGGWLDQRWQ